MPRTFIEADTASTLGNIKILDTDHAPYYVDEKSTIDYNPPHVALLRKLLAICDEVSGHCNIVIGQTRIVLVELPAGFGSAWYQALSNNPQIDPKQAQHEIDQSCVFTENHEKELNELNAKLHTDPQAAAKLIGDSIETVLSVVKEAIEIHAKLVSADTVKWHG